MSSGIIKDAMILMTIFRIQKQTVRYHRSDDYLYSP